MLAAMVEPIGQVVLARIAAWRGKRYAPVTGFMETGETPRSNITHEIAEETKLSRSALTLIDLCGFQRMNHVIIASHAVRRGDARLPQRWLITGRLNEALSNAGHMLAARRALTGCATRARPPR